jgi:hypothetical protein
VVTQKQKEKTNKNVLMPEPLVEKEKTARRSTVGSENGSARKGLKLLVKSERRTTPERKLLTRVWAWAMEVASGRSSRSGKTEVNDGK